MRARFDICILGGGPAGSALAIVLARAGAAVALVEKTGFADFRPGEHLPPAARGALRALGCDAALFADAMVESPGIVNRWAMPVPVFKRYAGAGSGFGFHLSRGRFDEALFRQAALAGVDAIDHAVVAEASSTGNGWELTVATRGSLRNISAPLVADATGRSAVFARRQGARWQAYGDLVAAAATIRPPATGAADDFTLLVEACEHGWWSVALTPSGESVATFYASAAMKRAMRLGTREWLRWGLASAPGVRRRLALSTDGGIAGAYVRPAFPRLLRPMHGPAWFALGDAAAAHDPLGGQGVVYALESAFRAAEMICADAPFASLAAIYEEAVESRLALHLINRASTYAEARPQFSQSRFWTQVAPRAPAVRA